MLKFVARYRDTILMLTLIASMLVALSLWLINRSWVAQSNEALILSVNSLIKHNHKVDQYLLAMRAGAMNNYDELVDVNAQFTHELQTLLASGGEQTLLSQAFLLNELQALETVWRQKQDLIEAIKSHLSLLKSSMIYLPSLISEVHDQGSDDNLALAKLLQVLNVEAINRRSDWYSMVLQRLAALRLDASAKDQIHAHIDIVNREHNSARSNVYKLAELNFEGQLEALLDAYAHSFAEQQMTAKQRSDVLLITITMLLLANMYFWTQSARQKRQLRSDNRNKDTVNRILERITKYNHSSIEAFYKDIALTLQNFFDSDIAVISLYCDEQKQVLETQVFLQDGEFLDNVRYNIAGTPCSDALSDSVCFVQEQAKDIYCEDHMLEELGIESYIGSRLVDAEGRPIGVISTMSRRALTVEPWLNSLLHLFVSRVVIEIERYKQLARINGQKEELEQTLNTVTEGVIAVDASAKVLNINPAAKALLALPLDTCPLGQPLANLMHLCADIEAEQPLLRCLDKGEVVRYDHDCNLISEQFEDRPISFSAAPFYGEDRQIDGAIVVLRDVSQEQKFREKLAYQALHDLLTGLPNRRAIEDYLRACLEQGTDERGHKQPETQAGQQAHAEQNALLFIDLDRFKTVNDTCGHAAGDELLRRIAKLFESALPKQAMLARLGGDEFVIVMPACQQQAAEHLAKTLLAKLQNFTFLFENQEFSIGASIGLLMFKRSGFSYSELMSMADMASLQAKKQGRNQYVVSQAGSADYSKHKGEALWIARIKSALSEDRFELYRQAALPRASFSDFPDLHQHCEILLRMRDEMGELVMPFHFIEAAERYDLMADIDRWVIDKVFYEMTRSNGSLRHIDSIAINLSGQSLAQASLLDYICNKLDHYQVEHKRVCFEITETNAIANRENAIHLMTELRRLGCVFALDDFGSGLSSYAYIKDLPADFVKIDKSFVMTLASDRVNQAIVKSIIDIAKNIGMRSIAEGVEDAETLLLLGEMGVDYAQGYYIERPHPCKHSTLKKVVDL